MYGGFVSLVTHKNVTGFHLLPRSKVTGSSPTNSQHLWQSFPTESNPPTPIETKYTIWACSRFNRLNLPSETEFVQRVQQATNSKEKFSLLKDVKHECYYDILGEVIKVYDGATGVVSLYLSDYTANSFFFNYAWGQDDSDLAGRDGDVYGYTKSKRKSDQEWPGPYGKLTLQMTLFDEHAEFIRSNQDHIVNKWVLFKNVQIKYGKNGKKLEGFLRGDRMSFPGKVSIQIMETPKDSDIINPRWKEGIRRKYDWWKKFKEQKQQILDEAAGLGGKRKHENEEGSTKSGKQRRQEKRAAAFAKVAAAEARVVEKLDINKNS